jgi:pyruvate,orthophosphate dikinase
MQDLEFTMRTASCGCCRPVRQAHRQGGLKIAVDMAGEGLILREEAVMRIDPASLDQLLHPTIDPHAPATSSPTGLPASPGAATGEIVFTSERPKKQPPRQGRKVILVRVETSPEDIHGMHAAEGILTSRGGMTSHAAVVARGMGNALASPAPVHLRIDYANGTLVSLAQR